MNGMTRAGQKQWTTKRFSNNSCSAIQYLVKILSISCVLHKTYHKFWQGWKESNLRMPESKSGALTNLATPLHGTIVCHLTAKQPTHNNIHLFATRSLPTSQRVDLQTTALANVPAIYMTRIIHFMRQISKNCAT